MVGATFLSGAYVQSQRGHVGIAALASVLPPKVNRWRVALADVISFLFCSFFSWKSWTLLREAVVDGQTTSSTWGPPLWIPYGLMATGMSLVAAQLLLQSVAHFAAAEERR
jgi:TRAP-type C4-dicarboxylate transport system permease small subunit